jgi:hypothetical protein
MDRNVLTHEYIQLMSAAETATNRKEALECIRKATRLKEAADLLAQTPPSDRYSRWCGGPGGFDDFAERLH